MLTYLLATFKENKKELMTARTIMFLLLFVAVSAKALISPAVEVDTTKSNYSEVSLVPVVSMSPIRPSMRFPYMVNSTVAESVEQATLIVTTDNKYKLNNDQKRLLDIARTEGEVVGFPETIQAILMQESLAGLVGPVGDKKNGFGKRSYCPMQIKLAAAKHVLKEYGEINSYETDEEIIAKLLMDEEFCIQTGARYFAIMAKNTTSWPEAVLSYNRGLQGAKNGSDPMNYLEKIRMKIKTVVRHHNTITLAIN